MFISKKPRLGMMLLLAAWLLGGCLQNHGIMQKSGAKGKQTRQTVFVEQSWTGEISHETRIKVDEIEAITNHEQWQKVWKVFRGNEALPAVDFKEYLIIQAINADSSKFELAFSRDSEGELVYSMDRSPDDKVNPKMCSYLLVKIKREGIRSFQAKLIVPPKCE